MKRFFLFFFAFMLLGAFGAKAQVTIGADRAPHPGAVLELESGGSKGLLLPTVTLNDAGTWDLDGSATEGMMVYNENAATTSGLKGKGIYVWKNLQWNMAHEEPCSGPPTLGGIAISPAGNIKINTPFTASVPPVADVVSYEWTLPAELKGQSNTNVISLVGIKAGTNYSIIVTATNACGTGTGSSQGILVTIIN